MTTIALKDGILAADTQLTLGDSTKILSDDKITILNKHTILAAAGDSIAILLAQRYFAQPNWEELFDKRPAELLEKDKDGEYEFTLDSILLFKGVPFLVDRFLIPEPLRHPFIAVGSGWQFAMGAMHTGMSAVDAVEFASKFDIYTNNKVRALNVKEFFQSAEKPKRATRRTPPVEAKETGSGETPVQRDNGG